MKIITKNKFEKDLIALYNQLLDAKKLGLITEMILISAGDVVHCQVRNNYHISNESDLPFLVKEIKIKLNNNRVADSNKKNTLKYIKEKFYSIDKIFCPKTQDWIHITFARNKVF